jgi:hypothetical protein
MFTGTCNPYVTIRLFTREPHTITLGRVKAACTNKKKPQASPDLGGRGNRPERLGASI